MKKSVFRLIVPLVLTAAAIYFMPVFIAKAMAAILLTFGLLRLFIISRIRKFMGRMVHTAPADSLRSMTAEEYNQLKLRSFAERQAYYKQQTPD
jgi:hypothetical protein